MTLPEAKNLTDRLGSVDSYLVAAIGSAAFLFAMWYLPAYRSTGVAPPFFYQDQFGPAVMQACGRGFVNPDHTTAPALQAFLDQKTDHLTCEQIPSSLRIVTLKAFQGNHRYLMTAAALVWRTVGLAWRSLDLLFATFFAVTMAAAYAALRFVCGRALSLFVTLLWAISPSHLDNLPHLRDYSKAPFFVLGLIATAMAFAEHRPIRLLALGMVFGIIQGLGFGMRTDVVLNFVPFFIVLFVGVPEAAIRNLNAKLACAAAAIAMFIVAGYPILRSYHEHSASWHVSLLGLMVPYDDILHLKVPRPPYNFGYTYMDGYVETVVRSYWSRVHPGAGPVLLGTNPYDPACREYYSALARTFPGDILTRMAASAVRVLNFPFSLMYGHVARGVTNPAFVWLSERRASLMQLFEGAGPIAFASILVLIGLERLYYACVAFLVLSFLAAYPFFQFEGRHVFHLEFLVLALIACGCSMTWRWLHRMQKEESRSVMGTRVLRSMATVGSLIAIAVVALVVARGIQVPRARALLTAYSNIPIDPVPTTSSPVADGRVHLAASVFGPLPPGDGVLTAMLVAEFASDPRGMTPAIDATFRYEQTNPTFSLDFSRNATVPISRGENSPTRVFFPAYSVYGNGAVMSRFVGLDVPMSQASCVKLWQVRNVAELPALLLPTTLRTDWGDVRLYQRLSTDRMLPPSVWRRLSGWWPRLSQVG